MSKVISINIPRTIIGLGAINNIGDIARSFSATKILLLTDPGIVKAGIIEIVKMPLEKAGLAYDVFAECKEEPPVKLMGELAQKVKAGGYDLLIAVGGGSVMDTCKTVSVTAVSGLTLKDYLGKRYHEKIEGRIIPKILVPTTSGTGSEWSINVAIYDHEANTSNIVRAWEATADRVIIDPELTFKLPARKTADTGFDALCHAIEAYTSANANVYSDMMASTAIKLVSENLRQVYSKGQLNIEARYNMSVSAALAMNAMVAAGGGLGHYISEFLGPKAHSSHGATLSTVLPAVMDFNMLANPVKFAALAELMGEDIYGLSSMEAAAKAAEAVRKLIKDVGLPERLSEIGITEADIHDIARNCYTATRGVIATSNPRDATEEDVAGILRASL